MTMHSLAMMLWLPANKATIASSPKECFSGFEELGWDNQGYSLSLMNGIGQEHHLGAPKSEQDCS